MPNWEIQAVIEIPPRPADTPKPAGDRCFLYRGASMAPTFSPGQLLHVRPKHTAIKPGDVIIFSDSSQNSFTVHRVISQTPRGFLTRGDNNSRPDSRPVTLQRLVGRVEMAELRGRVKPVRGGKLRLWRARLRWGGFGLRRRLRRFFGAPYRSLQSSRILRSLLRRFFRGEFRTIRFETPGGPLVKTTYNGRTVARWWPALDQYECRKPFDWLIPRPGIHRHPGEPDSTIKPGAGLRKS